MEIGCCQEKIIAREHIGKKKKKIFLGFYFELILCLLSFFSLFMEIIDTQNFFRFNYDVGGIVVQGSVLPLSTCGYFSVSFILGSLS